ncbi:MAG: hypothetical protein AAF160_04625 [Pseudomonadota bacterium]
MTENTIHSGDMPSQESADSFGENWFARLALALHLLGHEKAPIDYLEGLSLDDAGVTDAIIGVCERYGISVRYVFVGPTDDFEGIRAPWHEHMPRPRYVN